MFSIILVNKSDAIEDTSTAQFSFTKSSDIALGEKIQVDIHSPNGVSWVRYNWDINNFNWNTNLIEVNPTQIDYHLEIETPNKIGVHTLTIMARDNAGNDSVWYSINYMIVDKLKPVISLNGDSHVVINAGDIYKDLGATAIDNYDGNISRRVLVKSNLNIHKTGDYKIEYTVKDSSGNYSDVVTRNIRVGQNAKMDNKNTMILNGNEFLSLNVGDRYIEQGAIVTDIRGNISYATVAGIVDTSRVGTYKLTYSTDKNINPTTRTVTVNKGTYDLNNITFNNKTVMYDGLLQSIHINGALPTGVSVQYFGNYVNAVGTYTITAKFSGDFENYNSIPNRTAVLTILPLPVPEPEPPVEPITPVIPPVEPPVEPPVDPYEEFEFEIIGDLSHSDGKMNYYYGDVTIKFNKGTADLFKLDDTPYPEKINDGHVISRDKDGYGDYMIRFTYLNEKGDIVEKIVRFHIRYLKRENGGDVHWPRR
jgi:hypothetical protein